VSRLLPPAIDAEECLIDLGSGDQMLCYQDARGEGSPVVLLHSMNAAPSAAEVKPLFEAFRASRPVLAPDLPGFGRSTRRDRPYTPAFYAQAIERLVDSVAPRRVHLLALSTTSEFAARVAAERPEQVASLTIVSPTGLGSRTPPGEIASARIHRFLRAPVVGASLYRVLRTRPSIRYFLAQSFHGAPPSELVDYACRTTAQPGASLAPFYFLSGKMFAADALNSLYRAVGVPSLVVYDKDPHTGFERLPELLDSSPHWRAVRIEGSAGLPHFDQPDATFSALQTFWDEVPG